MLDTVNGGGLVSDDVMVNLVVENLRKLKSNQVRLYSLFLSSSLLLTWK